MNTIIKFGFGEVVLERGTYDGQESIFVRAAKNTGVVGEDVPKSEIGEKDKLEEGETVLTFLSGEFADRVYDMLTISAPKL